jgi:hypothetical protein
MKITEIFIHMNIEVTLLQTWRLSEKIILFLFKSTGTATPGFFSIEITKN